MMKMLVLTRRLMESVKIGENIYVTIVKIDGGLIRIGIEAPTEIPIIRTELLNDHDHRRINHNPPQ